MPDPAFALTDDQRRRLLDALDRLALTDTPAGRTLLLANLPPALAAALPRHEGKIDDLAALVDGIAGGATPDDAAPALLELIGTARASAAGGPAADALRDLYRELA
jgi:hypothetical protein